MILCFETISSQINSLVSSVAAQLTFLDKCVKTLARGDTVDTMYLDFSKGFDTVPHCCLLGKLEAYGIDGSLLSWISSFLMGHTQTESVCKWQSLI